MTRPLTLRSPVPLLLLLAASVACPRALAAPALEDNLLTLLPAARHMPAPDWIQQGVRVTYDAASAKVAGDMVHLFRNNFGASNPDEIGASGRGPVQWDCIAQTPTQVVGNITLCVVVDPATGKLACTPAGPSVDVPGCGSVWCNPEALATADQLHDEHLVVKKLPYPMGDKTYRAIAFQYTTDTSVTTTLYDLDSGLEISYSHAILSEDGQSTQMAVSRYLGTRQVRLPARAEAAPAWAATTRTLTYNGNMTVQIPASPELPMPIGMTVQRQAGGAKWTHYHMVQTTNGMAGGSYDLACGVASLCGGPWMAPEILAACRPGQELDSDPITHIRVVVEGVGGPDNTQVALSQTGPGLRNLYAYDIHSGKLLRMISSQEVGVAVQVSDLRLAGEG